jgi:Tetratricopeptide repeat
VEVVRTAVLGELRARGRWLLVFDNAETAADVRRWLPGGSGHVLITSRQHGWGEIAVPVEVDVLSRPESVTLLRDRVPDLAEVHANRLAGRLGDLPLAVAQAAGFMAETGMPAEQYLRLLETPNTLMSASNLAAYLHGLQEVQAALDLEQDTLDRRRRILGQDHPDTLRSASNLAYYTSQLEEAEA